MGFSHMGTPGFQNSDISVPSTQAPVADFTLQAADYLEGKDSGTTDSHCGILRRCAASPIL